jgi:hypothetical protein
MFRFLGQKYPTSRLAAVSSTGDSVISLIYGWGRNQCANIDGLDLPQSVLRFNEGLKATREQFMKPSPAWGSFYTNSLTHTWIGRDAYYTRKVRGVKLVDWVADLVRGAPSRHIAP